MRNLLLIFLFLFSACDRVDDSLNGRCVYAGKVYLVDSLAGPKDLVETDSVVTVTVSKDGKPYFLYEKKTLTKGNFIMDFLELGETYKASASLKVNGVSYKGETVFKADNEDGRKYHLSLIEDTVKLTLFANVDKRNQIVVMTKDIHGAAVPTGVGALFSSSELFQTRNVLNANYTATGDASGKIIFSNVKGGYYYLMVQKRLDTLAGARVLIGIDSFDVLETGVQKRPDISVQ